MQSILHLHTFILPRATRRVLAEVSAAVPGLTGWGWRGLPRALRQAYIMYIALRTSFGSITDRG